MTPATDDQHEILLSINYFEWKKVLEIPQCPPHWGYFTKRFKLGALNQTLVPRPVHE